MATDDDQMRPSTEEHGNAVAQDPEAAQEELSEAACETEQALQQGVPVDQLMRRILLNQGYMLNVLRWLVGREAERLRQADEKE